MKIRHIISYLILLPLIAVMSSCVDDFFDDKMAGLAPGTPVEVSLGISVPKSKPMLATSRISPETQLNRQVYDLYLFLFDADQNSETYGALKSKFYFASITGSSQIQCDPALSSNGSAMIIRTKDDAGKEQVGIGEIHHIHTTAGQTKIVGVANVSVKGSANILARLSNVKNFAELQQIMVSTVDPQGNSDLESELAVMSGFYCQNDNHQIYSTCDPMTDDHNGEVYISSEPLKGTVWLTPLQARVTFAIDGNGADVDGKPGGKFELLSWQVYNLPANTPLLCPGTSTVEVDTINVEPISTVFHFDFNKIPNYTGEVPDAEHSYGFTFFPADRHPGGPKSGNDITSYEQRAAWTTTKSGETVEPEDKVYLNAPQGSTYVVLRGRYEGWSSVTDGDGKTTSEEVSADVTYTIFLGHGSDSDFNNFNTYRNHDYTYIVRIKGVNQISVEVNQSKEDRPDAEGNIAVLGSRVEMLDCHFEQRRVAINRKQVKDAVQNHTFRMIVDEPVFNVNKRTYKYFRINDETGAYEVDNNGNTIVAGDFDPEDALPYMNWVQFYRHKEDEKTRKYIPYTKPKRDGELMDVRAFMADLLEFAESGTDEKEEAEYTLYFDEYVYLQEENGQVLQRHPITHQEAKWQSLVGKTGVRSFTMMGSTKFSNDHNSSYSTAGTSFQQRRMQTIYNPSAPGLERAWATECVEEDIISTGGKTYTYLPNNHYGKFYGADRDDSSPVRYGRQNGWIALQASEKTGFDEVIDEYTGYMKKLGNKCFYTECMGRNRDLNGNGVIDPEEFRWYVPSIEQLELLYIGREGLTPEAQLYNVELETPNFVMHTKEGTTNKTYLFKHYMSSSNSRIWSEEGGSISNNGYHSDAYGNRLYVRCVRDIGTDGSRGANIPGDISGASGEGARFQSVYEVVEGADLGGREHVKCRIRLSRLNNEAVRRTAERRERPGIVDTFSDSNKPYYEIEIADTIITGVNFKENIGWASASPQQPTRCETVLGQGWRMPTLPEIIAVRWEKPALMDGTVGSRTRSYFYDAGIWQDKWYKLPGWIHISRGGRYALEDEWKGVNFSLRCVRDYMADTADDE